MENEFQRVSNPVRPLKSKATILAENIQPRKEADAVKKQNMLKKKTELRSAFKDLSQNPIEVPSKTNKPIDKLTTRNMASTASNKYSVLSTSGKKPKIKLFEDVTENGEEDGDIETCNRRSTINPDLDMRNERFVFYDPEKKKEVELTMSELRDSLREAPPVLEDHTKLLSCTRNLDKKMEDLKKFEEEYYQYKM